LSKGILSFGKDEIPFDFVGCETWTEESSCSGSFGLNQQNRAVNMQLYYNILCRPINRPGAVSGFLKPAP